MKNNQKQLDIVFLLDRSGSMQGSEKDTIGGYNSYINKYKNTNALVTTVLFDNEYEMITNREEISKIKKLTEKKYYVRGCTALLDAIGKTINYLDKKTKNKVLFIITTDGLENASREYTKEKIKELIMGHPNFEFIYIGADIDSYTEAEKLGIDKSRTANYRKTKEGTKELFHAIGNLTEAAFNGECLKDCSWKENLE